MSLDYECRNIGPVPVDGPHRFGYGYGSKISSICGNSYFTV